MRRFRLFFLCFLCFLLTACGSEIYRVVTPENLTLTIDTTACTLRHGDDLYTYEISGNTTTITYPNGAKYINTETSQGRADSWDNTYDPECYVDGSILSDALETERDRKNGGTNWFWPILLIAIGVWQLIRPQTAWFLTHGIWYKNAEPSAIGLALVRISGGLIVAVGVCLCFT